MRHDMQSVVTEPAREGSAYYHTLPNDYRKAKKFKLDEELEVYDQFCANVLPMRAKSVGWDGKSKRFNTNPIKCFLRSSIGRNWDEVYSEICKVFKVGVRGNHSGYVDVDNMIRWEISTNTFLGADGKVYYNDSYHGCQCVNDDYNKLYVDPRDGTIKVSSGISYKDIRKQRKAERDQVSMLTCFVLEGNTYRKIDDTWFRETTITKKIYPSPYLQYETTLRTLSKKELKALG